MMGKIHMGWVMIFLSSSLVAQNRCVVFCQCGGEMVGAIFLGDKIQKRSGGRVENGLDGSGTGIADRAGRQASTCIGVIGSIGKKVGPCEVAIEALESIDHSGIALKPDPSPEAVEENPCDQWSFLRHTSLLFNH